jgi:hypothetical protein
VQERIDEIVNLDICGRGSRHLYKAARDVVGEPLAMAAARRFMELKRGDIVLFTTGFPARCRVSPRIGENDGPAGTAVLARALQRSFGIIPVVMTEAALGPAIGAVLQNAGFNLLSIDEARIAAEHPSPTASAVLQPYPTVDSEALAAADPLIDRLQPKLAVAVERPGRNHAGVYHDMKGMPLGNGEGRTDLLFERLLDRRIPVVAFGDGGNEIGMGLVLSAVRDYVPYGRECRCSCKAGIAARTKADILVTAAVSNWGCYAVVACLAILLKDPTLLHTAEAERRLLAAGVQAGLINSFIGAVDPGVDGLPLEANTAIVQLLHTMATKAIG